MGIFYKKLILPSVDKLIKASELNATITTWQDSYRVREVNEMLTDEAVDFFMSYGLEPTFVIDLLPGFKTEGPAETRMIHTDTTIVDGRWKPMVCGINFELLEDSEAEMSWWNMDKFEPLYEGIYPENTEIERKINLRGIIYSLDPGVPDGAEFLEKIHYGTTPYLFRTNVPHMVTFNNVSRRRRGISIRFKEHWTNWEECCKVFEPLMSK